MDNEITKALHELVSRQDYEVAPTEAWILVPELGTIFLQKGHEPLLVGEKGMLRMSYEQVRQMEDWIAKNA